MDRSRKYRSRPREMKGVGRTRPGRAKERVMVERASTGAKEDLEAKEDSRSRRKKRRTTGRM